MATEVVGQLAVTEKELKKIDLPVKVVVLNNFGDGMVRQWQKLFFKGRMSASDKSLHKKDFIKVARTYSKRQGISYSAWRKVGVEPAVLKAAIRGLTCKIELIPVLCGSAFKKKGVQVLVDASDPTASQSAIADAQAVGQSTNLALLSGDMHALAYDDGTHSDYATGGGAPLGGHRRPLRTAHAVTGQRGRDLSSERSECSRCGARTQRRGRPSGRRAVPRGRRGRLGR